MEKLRPSRRLVWSVAAGSLVLGAALLTGCDSGAEERIAMTVHRNAGCGCCEIWKSQAEATGRFDVRMLDDPELDTFKQSRGIPADLASCHTTEVGPYVVEGHVPLADVARLLASNSQDITALAVAGMPIGSPGMESADGRRDAFEVVALKRDGTRSVYAFYPASP